ncbi:pleurotolysin A [Lasiosphaeria ovina]|uniref:Pleurotolysin A n=1 Tax=Lasiosphaeria ovina TaxID=92902 RepID=A0AAE0JTI0_9PEZI|nr:pleurotolysin A [Lasiosphaeria ovina]
MAYSQWIYMIINNLSKSGDLKFKNLSTKWGKLYQWDNKDQELSSADVTKQVAGPLGKIEIASCGRSGASSGTEGNYDIYNGDTRVCHIYWDCPWGKKANTFTVSNVNDNFVVQATGQNPSSGASGTVTIKVVSLA